MPREDVRHDHLGGVPAPNDSFDGNRRAEKEGVGINTTQDRRRVRRAWLRIGLLIVAATPLVGGLWALLFPRAFYDDFPLPGRAWVSTLGPYNEHLVRDVGALNLALGVLLVVAAVLLERRLVQASLVAYLVYVLASARRPP